MDFLWGVMDGFVAIVIVIGNVFGKDWSFYDGSRAGFQYNVGFMLGISSAYGSSSAATKRK